MKNIDIKSLIIGALLTSTIFLGVAAAQEGSGSNIRKAMIKKFDKNGDGKLDEEERPSREELQEFFRTQVGGGQGDKPTDGIVPPRVIPKTKVKDWDYNQLWEITVGDTSYREYSPAGGYTGQFKRLGQIWDNAALGAEPFAIQGKNTIFRKRIK